MKSNDPIALFQTWFEEAVAAGVRNPEIMVLATSSKSGVPSARVVLFRGLSEGGFRFFTNYDSRKGHELEENPHAALVFHWDPQERQVRVEGRVEKLSPTESDAYFEARPHGHRIGAWASDQSREIAAREVLLKKQADALARYGAEVPRPPHWGGYRVVPHMIELWQGKPDRLHERNVFTRTDAGWTHALLSP
ncbi:MAG: pyridoxamine 5'-phosphate oxidase [Polyangiales bacterium]